METGLERLQAANKLDAIGGCTLGIAIGLIFWLGLLASATWQLGPQMALAAAIVVLAVSAAVILVLMQPAGGKPVTPPSARA
jgi:Kef-type K+ transport system membrane component KefB